MKVSLGELQSIWSFFLLKQSESEDWGTRSSSGTPSLPQQHQPDAGLTGHRGYDQVRQCKSGLIEPPLNKYLVNSPTYHLTIISELSCGLYYKHITIVIDAPKWRSKL